MEVGDEAGGDFEAVAGLDEQGRFSLPALGRTAVGGPGFQRAEGGGADRDNVFPLFLGVQNGLGRGGGHVGGFRVQALGRDLFRRRVEEGARANVEGDMGDVEALFLQVLQDMGGDVQARGGGGNRAGFGGIGIDGLIALANGGGILRADVRWQRGVAVFLKIAGDVFRREIEADMRGFAFEHDRGGGAAGQVQGIAFLKAAARAGKGLPRLQGGFQWAVEKDFNRHIRPLPCPCRARGVQAGGDDAAIVEDQQVARLKQAGEVGNTAFSDVVGCLFIFENEQARIFAWLDGASCDEFWWERVIEQLGLHGARSLSGGDGRQQSVQKD